MGSNPILSSIMKPHHETPDKMTATELHEQLLSAILAGIEANREDEFTATVELEDTDGCVCAVVEASVSYRYYGSTDHRTGYWEADTAEVSIIDVSADIPQVQTMLRSIDIHRLEERAQAALRA